MAMTEDAASVLEEFVQNVANLPAEIQHLLEEIQAKDKVMQDCRSQIITRDSSIQKFLKANGCTQANPKEEAYCTAAMTNFDKAQHVQDEKVALSDRAATLLDRQIKRLDVKIRDLQNEGSIQPDPQLPSLLSNASLHTRLPSINTAANGTNAAQQAVGGNAPPSTTIANAPIQRLVQPSSHRQPSPLATTAASAAIQAQIPAAARQAPRSPSADNQKRRRLNPNLLNAPAQSSSLRQSSLGPGTPRASGGSEAPSRGSSVGPQRPGSKKAIGVRIPPGPNGGAVPQRVNHLNPVSGNGGSNNKKSAMRRAAARSARQKSGTPTSSTKDEDVTGTSTTGISGNDGTEDVDPENDEDVEMEDADPATVSTNTTTTTTGGGGGITGANDEDEEDEGEGDDKKYCTCHSVSYGNMVACDNDDCPYEWFHWSCVGITSEPKGKWFCTDCRGKK